MNKSIPIATTCTIGLLFCTLLIGLGRMKWSSRSGSEEFAWQAQEQLERETGRVSENTKRELANAIAWKNALTQAAIMLKSQEQASTSFLNALLSSVSLALLAAYLGLSILLVLVWMCVSRDPKTLRVSSWPIGILVAGTCLSIFFEGVGPAGLVSESTQHWVLTVITLATLVVLLGGIAMRMRYRLQFSIRSLLIASTVVAVLLQVVFEWQLGWSSVGLPIKVNAKPDPLMQLAISQDPGFFERWLPGQAWVASSCTQWLVHNGARLALILSFVFAGIVLVWRRSVKDSFGKLLCGIVLCTLFFANVWVWLEPRNYVSSRPKQIRLEQYIESIDLYYEPVRNAITSLLDQSK